MKNIRIPILVVALFAGGAILHGQDKGNCFTDLIHSSYSSKLFNKVPVTDRQIELVLQSGVRAPSARNSQTWRFMVVKDNMLAQGIIRDALPGYVLIVVSGPETDQPGMNTDIDCSPATAYIYLAAQSLGLASHLYTGPVGEINEKYREKLGLTEGYKVILVMKMGNVNDPVDGVSSASPRNDLKAFVSFR